MFLSNFYHRHDREGGLVEIWSGDDGLTVMGNIAWDNLSISSIDTIKIQVVGVFYSVGFVTCSVVKQLLLHYCVLD